MSMGQFIDFDSYYGRTLVLVVVVVVVSFVVVVVLFRLVPYLRVSQIFGHLNYNRIFFFH